MTTRTAQLQPAHVVLSCGNSVGVVIALQANLQSMVQNTQPSHRHLLHLHFFQVEPLPKDFLQEWLPQWLKQYPQVHWHYYKVKDEEIQPYLNPHLTFQQRRLQANSNFVRFILHERLDDNITACLWMDTDMIVWGDTVLWMNQYYPHRHALAAFPRHRCTYPFVNQSFYPLFAQNDIRVSNDDSTAFNAGIIYLNLQLWRAQGIDHQLTKICQLNAKHNFYPTSGSQAPLLLLFAGLQNFQALPLQQSVEYLGDKPIDNTTAALLNRQQQQQRQGSNAGIIQHNHKNDNDDTIMFLHWNGDRKPWYTIGLNTQYWLPYAPKGFQQYPKWKDKPKEKEDWKKKQKLLQA